MLLLWPKRSHQKEMLHKRPSSDAPVTQGTIRRKENTKEKETMLDQLKAMEFKKDGENVTMFHKGQELAMYIGSKKIEWVERFFKRPILQKWKMEKVTYENLPVSKLKISENLHHQC